MECPICLDEYEKKNMVIFDCDKTALMPDESKHMVCVGCHMMIEKNECPTCQCVFRHPVQALNLVLNGKNIVVLHRRKRFATDTSHCIIVDGFSFNFKNDWLQSEWYDNEGLYDELVQRGFEQLTTLREKMIAKFETGRNRPVVHCGDDFSILVENDGSGPAKNCINLLLKNKPLLQRGTIINGRVSTQYKPGKISKEDEQRVLDFVEKTWPSTSRCEPGPIPLWHEHTLLDEELVFNQTNDYEPEMIPFSDIYNMITGNVRINRFPGFAPNPEDMSREEWRDALSSLLRRT